MSTVLAQPAALLPTKSPTNWPETSTTDASSTSSIPASAAIPAHAPIAPIAVSTMSAGSRDALMHTASTQTDDGVLSWATGPTANRANDRSYSQGQAEKSGQEGDSGSPLPKPKVGAASHYLRRAEAHELPSFGNVGLANPEAAGAAAASLAHASTKPVEIWKPDPISAAETAACLAHTNPRRVELWKPTQGTGAGKAASHALEDSNDRAMQASRTGPSSALQHESGAKITRNALAAASLAHMPMVRRASNAVEPAFERLVENDLNNAGGVSQQERRKSDILRAATISMAQCNCDIHSPDSPRQWHRVPSPGRQRPATTPPSSRRPIYGPDLDEAACKVAAERLTLIGYDPERSASLLGAKGARASLSRSRPVTAEGAGAGGHSRTRIADGNPSRSRDNLTRLENKKRGEDAVLLMTAARRNVRAQMSGLDRQIADSKGLVRREDWETRARELAQAGHDKRQHQNHGKVSIGGGGYMTQEEIDAIAERNVRPVLDDMTRKAEAERARVSAEKARAAEGRMELEEKKRLQEVWRMQEKEVQEELKKAKAMGKEEEKRRKEEEKHRLKERRQSFKIGSKLAKGNNSNSQSLPPPAPTVSNSNSNLNSHAPITPTSPKAEKGLRGLINKFRARRHSRNVSRTSPKEFFSVSRTVATNNNATSNYSTAPSRYSNIPLPPSAPQNNGIQTPMTTPTLTEIALLGAPPSAPTASTPAQGSPPHPSSPVSSLHSFKCRGETVPEVYISDDDDGRGAACDDHNNDNNPRGRKMEDTESHSDSAEERDTFPGPPTAAVSQDRSGEHLPLDREASVGEPGNRSSVGSKFFENL